MISVLMAFIIVNPNPMVGPNNDWAPLRDAYEVCVHTSETRFEYTTCVVGAFDRANNPTWEA